jgi:hypothetical protein
MHPYGMVARGRSCRWQGWPGHGSRRSGDSPPRKPIVAISCLVPDYPALPRGFLMSVRRGRRLRLLAPRRQRARADKIPNSQLVISPSMLFAPKILAARRAKKERGAR